MNLKLAIQLLKNMGPRYVIYRIKHELEKKRGILLKKHPSNLAFKNSISLQDWKTIKQPYLIEAKENLIILKNPTKLLKSKGERILKGEFQFFNFEWKNIGLNYDWVSNPSNGFQYDVSKHWSQIPDLSELAGDIKFVWEKSRFSYLLTLIRYDYHFDKDLSEFVFSEIESWIDSNPINKGPNWRCSQEISLRIFNWTYALYYFQNSAALTEARWLKIQKTIYASLHHVYHHINFSRIAVRNNHAITETLFLNLSNILFPFIPETKEWSIKGRKWFEAEIAYQIYDDGTFLQFSMNYHRVVVQLLSLALSVTEKNNQPYPKEVYDKAYKSVEFLYQCTQEENGWLPNYGSNDGALFFPLVDADYRDYRPQLNTLYGILTGEKLYSALEINEDQLWYCFSKTPIYTYEVIRKLEGTKSYLKGGYFLCRQKNNFTFIRCGSHKDRPSQADNLHLELWCNGENILRDSGTYKYNTDSEKLDFFMGTKGHNAVMVNNESQMLRGSRFIWYFWSQKKQGYWEETDEEYIFCGEISAFRHLNKNASHKRIIHVKKQKDEWLVEDCLLNLKPFDAEQIWHPNSSSISIQSEENPTVFNSFNSDYYGQITEEKSILFPFKEHIKTTIYIVNNENTTPSPILFRR